MPDTRHAAPLSGKRFAALVALAVWISFLSALVIITLAQ